MKGILTIRHNEILTQNEEISKGYERKIRCEINKKLSKVFDDLEILMKSKLGKEFIKPVVLGIKRIYDILEA